MVNGVSAADVVEITQAEISRVREELSLSARDVAEERIASLIDAVTDHFATKPELFEAFREPDFQYSLQDAGRAAASNDEEHTERLLVDLLANRATKGNGARVRLATSQALRAADKLSIEALNGLTALWAITYLNWDTENLEETLELTAKDAERLLELALPPDPGWVEDADALNLLRVQRAGTQTRMTYSHLLQAKFSRFTQLGVDLTRNVQRWKRLERTVPEFMDLLRPHPLKKGFLMLPGKTPQEVMAMLPKGGEYNLWELENLISKAGPGSKDQRAVDELERLLSKWPAFGKLGRWWDAVPLTDFTVVGDVIGFVNARRHLDIEKVETVGQLLEHRSS